MAKKETGRYGAALRAATGLNGRGNRSSRERRPTARRARAWSPPPQDIVTLYPASRSVKRRSPAPPIEFHAARTLLGEFLTAIPYDKKAGITPQCGSDFKTAS